MGRSHFGSGSKQTAETLQNSRLAAKMVSKVSKIKVQPTLFKVSENSGKLAILHVARAPAIKKSTLDTDDCYIMPIADIEECYVWTGETTSGRERNQAVKMAIRIKKAIGTKCKVTVFPQGEEDQTFTDLFHDWENNNYSSTAPDALLDLYADARMYAERCINRKGCRSEALHNMIIGRKTVEKPTATTSEKKKKRSELISEGKSIHKPLNNMKTAALVFSDGIRTKSRREW